MRPTAESAAAGWGASLSRLFDRTILAFPGATVVLFLVLFAYFGYHSKDFRLDASADSLVLEHDEDLRYYNKISEIYSTKDFLIVTYKPEGDLFSEASLNGLRAVRDEIKALAWVDSVTTILDVPLLSNPQVPLKELRRNIKTLEDPKADLKLAIKEFTESPLYNNLIVSQDLRSTAIQVNVRADKSQQEWLKRRVALREKRYVSKLSPEEALELKGLEERYLHLKDIRGRERHKEILAIRGIVDRHSSKALFHLAGMPMIVDDILTFIRHDLKVGGFGLLTFFVLCLLVIFRRVRWVFLPLFCCASSVVVMMGLLGSFGWEVTVVSSNFISLKIIFTMQYVIYMVVTYRGLLREHPEAANRELILGTVRMMFIPILYSLLTE
ncbi:MAG: MMPL family transporter, partial [Elusimicrobiota bacterium]